jgi:hypothetical protein
VSGVVVAIVVAGVDVAVVLATVVETLCAFTADVAMNMLADRSATIAAIFNFFILFIFLLFHDLFVIRV